MGQTFGYIRISRNAKPTDRGSFDYQRQAIENYCLRHELGEIVWFVDYGNVLSERPALCYLIDVVSATRSFDADDKLLVTSFDRLTRRTTELVNMLSHSLQNVKIIDTSEEACIG